VADRIAIDLDVVESHARRVEALGADVQEAIDAAASMNVAGGAFGVLCSFLVPPALVVTTAARSALLGVHGAIGQSAATLRAGARDLVGCDEDAVQVLGALVDEVDRAGGAR
jgi:hypothetical protein